MSANPEQSASEFNEAIAEAYYWPLVLRLRKLAPRRFRDLADQSATDALMELLQRPSRLKGKSIEAYLYRVGRLTLMRSVSSEVMHEDTYGSLEELDPDA